MIILVGASASGKTEIAKLLIDKFKYKKTVTTTTRSLRKGEIAGVSYHFVSKEEFKRLMEADAFVETAFYQNECYGTQKKDLCKEGVIILEPNGANFLIAYLEDNAFVVLIESSKKIRKKRMIKRGDSPEEIKRRLKKDDKHFAKNNLNKIDLLLNNHNQTLEELAETINKEYKKHCL